MVVVALALTLGKIDDSFIGNSQLTRLSLGKSAAVLCPVYY